MIHPLLPVSVAVLRTALKNREGVTAAEYAIMAVALVAAVSAAIATFGPMLKNALQGISFTAPTTG
ncbi:hypothetical protein GCM10011504_31540 [Siccirubricoccus deserti]|uniref:Flp family type IVb pilin n=1 Tax=Siccirubricoccus deserti TaxID=2013562 RepID=A0A9X0QZE0_9PROT|nr:Flp family type IVb pilin [Siccirubricoccus deserti]MBC4016654.1 Flp family type IVb pilin [Siccirubricoccus deserti]GGC50805.1 hypothetical protein GCM10011504_31540 [Siccirubricoccus deserti]